MRWIRSINKVNRIGNIFDFSSDGMDRKLYLKKIGSREYRVYSQLTSETWFAIEVRKTLIGSWDYGKTWYMNIAGNNPSDSNFQEQNATEVTDEGVWAYAITETESDTWMGSHHGNDDEVFTQWLADGIPVDLSNGDVIDCENLVFAQKSMLIKPNTETEVAEVWKHNTFSKGAVNIKYEINWIEDVNVKLAYVAMCTFKKTSEGFTDARYLEDDVIQDISGTFSTRRVDDYGVNTWNKAEGIASKVEVLNPEEAIDGYTKNGNTKTFIRSASNKFYVTRIDSDTLINSGEKWKVDFSVNFYSTN